MFISGTYAIDFGVANVSETGGTAQFLADDWSQHTETRLWAKGALVIAGVFASSHS
jgi:hypothetical protein